MIDQKKIDQLLKEVEDLESLGISLESFINKAQADQLLIKQIVEEMDSWKSGKAQEAFLSTMEDYFETLSRKLRHFETISSDIDSAKTGVRFSLAMEQTPKGPKW
ncbi:hypothetical protein MOF27_21685 [Priestia megaterium]|jgi:hypothetical protein|uniref:hypothetical protein n=1 Tax=Priestia megaterium TaxID=1404 RepID=UPI00227ED186|nr:hypothetical protein [Priestia megaterium]MCY9019984.1 hypothetical protein [Priestia megaterium]